MFKRSGYFSARVGKIYHYGNPGQIGTSGLDDPASWDASSTRAESTRTKRRRSRISRPTRGLGSSLSYYASPAPDDEHTDGKVAAETIALLEKHRDRPFFIGAGFYRPHCPFIAPRKYFDLYPLDRIQAPPSISALPADVPSAAWFTNPPHWDVNEAGQRESIRAYYASISFLDANVGRVLDALDRLRLTDNTIVVFVSDHGYHLGERGQWMKQTLFERSARTPLIVAGPGVSARGRASSRVVELLDLYPDARRPRAHDRAVGPGGAFAGAAPEEPPCRVEPCRGDAGSTGNRREHLHGLLRAHREVAVHGVGRRHARHGALRRGGGSERAAQPRDRSEAPGNRRGDGTAARAGEGEMTGLIAICGAAVLAAAVFGATGRANTPYTPALQSAPSRARPNIVWISNEDMSPHLGAYGDTLARTPVLDRLAKESIRYTRAFTTAPVCAPSRAAIITGMYQNAIGAQHMRTTEDRVPELPGPYLAVPPFYVKAFPGIPPRGRLLHEQSTPRPTTSSACRSRSGTTSAARAHWRNRPDKSQPFFSVFNLEVTHESQIFPSSPARKGKPLVTEPGQRPGAAVLSRHAARPRRARAHVRQHRRHGRPGRRDPQAARSDGLADNTIVFYWSDHGDGVPRSKRSLYDSGLRVPLMIRWPKGLGSCGAARNGERRARQLRRSRADRARRSPASRSLPIFRAACSSAHLRAQPRRFVFAARDRMDIEYDMMRSARDAQVSLHPQLCARAALRRPHHLSQPERHHAGVVQASGRRQVDRRGCAVDADLAAGRGALRHDRRSVPDSQSLRRSRTQGHARANATRGYGVDDANRRSGPHQRTGDDSADVARRRAAGNSAALHRLPPHDGRAEQTGNR